MQEAIVVRGLSKKYRRYHHNRPHTLQEAILQGLWRMGAAEEFWALNGIDFSISTGRMVGVIGSNGAGKSTLLRLVGGVGRPDKGTVDVRGRIGALLDLGAGFHSDLTGRENVYVNGVIAGLTRQQVKQRFDEIVAFAELEDFIDNPLRTYSTGMKMRLGFAVAGHIEPDILLIDEVLAVGDMAFQKKCLDRIGQFKEAGCTILLVSHDIATVRQLCDEVLWLRAGQVVAHGPAGVVAGQYVSDMTAETRRRTPTRPPRYTPAGVELRLKENRFGSLEMEITGVRLLGADRQPVMALQPGAPLSVEISYSAPEPVDAPIFGVTISRDDGLVCFDTSIVAGCTPPVVSGPGKVVLHLERLDLQGGAYFVDVGIYQRQWAYAYDYHWHTYPLHLRQTEGDQGVVRPPYRWEVQPFDELTAAGSQSGEVKQAIIMP